MKLHFQKSVLALFFALMFTVCCSAPCFAADTSSSSSSSSTGIDAGEVGDAFTGGLDDVSGAVDDIQSDVPTNPEGGFSSFLAAFFANIVPAPFIWAYSFMLVGMAVVAVVKALVG